MSDPIPELRLWQAVLWRANQDLQASESSRDREFQNVRRWIGEYPSRDFREVCMMANFEPDFVHPRLHKALSEKLERLAPYRQSKNFAAE